MTVSAAVVISRIVLILGAGILLWLVGRAAGWKRTVVGLVASAAVGAALWTYNTMVWRDAEYLRIVDEFRHATAFAKQKDIGDGRSGWNEEIAVATGIHAKVRAGDHLDIATVQYSDESSAREVFAPTDYINISDVRRRGAVLYVLRSISLFRVEYRLAVFDLNRRATMADRRVDLRDVK